MKLSTSLLIGLFLASAADATFKTKLNPSISTLGINSSNEYARKAVLNAKANQLKIQNDLLNPGKLNEKPGNSQNGMQYPVFGLAGRVFGSSLAAKSSSYPLDTLFGPNSLISKTLMRIKEQERTLKIENGDQQQEIQGENTDDTSSKDMSIASSKSKPSLYSLPDIKYVLLNQQGKEFKLNADSRNLVTRLFAEIERYKAENDVENAKALLEEIFTLLDKKGLTLHFGIDGTPMRSVTKDNMITALGAPQSTIDYFKSILDYDSERKPSHKIALTGIDLAEISSQNSYGNNPESDDISLEPAQNDAIDKPLSLVLFNNQGNEVKIVTESVNRSVSELEHLIQTQNDKFFKWLEENHLTLYASLNGGHLVPVNGDEFISFFGNPGSNLLMLENGETDAEAETEKEEYEVILEAIRGLFQDKNEESVEKISGITVVSAGKPEPPHPAENQNVNNGIFAAASTISNDSTENLYVEPTKSKFPWKAFMLSAGGLALVAAIVSAVYIASQTIQDEESVDL